MGLVTLLLWHWRDRFAPGVLFGLYLIFAGLERFLVEFIRRNDAVIAGLTVPQLFSLAMLAGGRPWWRAATCRGRLPPERRAERGGGAQHQRDRRARGGARLSGQLDAGDAGRRGDRGARDHRGARVVHVAAHRDGPCHQRREHEQRPRDLGPYGDARGHQGEQRQPDQTGLEPERALAPAGSNAVAVNGRRRAASSAPPAASRTAAARSPPWLSCNRAGRASPCRSSQRCS